jgi:hypothetical protein
MQWPFKTTVRFDGEQGSSRLRYAVSAESASEAKSELERRFLGQEVSGYTIEHVVAATGHEAAQFELPNGCVMLLG